jgi:hypothetical protein
MKPELIYGTAFAMVDNLKALNINPADVLSIVEIMRTYANNEYMNWQPLRGRKYPEPIEPIKKK